jgi:hypothetical protein
LHVVPLLPVTWWTWLVDNPPFPAWFGERLKKGGQAWFDVGGDPGGAGGTSRVLACLLGDVLPSVGLDNQEEREGTVAGAFGCLCLLA